MKLHHFYHIYADGQWREPVQEHIDAMLVSGLYKSLSSLSIGFVGSRENIISAHHYVQSRGLSYFIAGEQSSGWEQVTMIPMWQFCQENEGLMLYAHSKGSANQNEVNTRWRRSMTWHNVWQWRFAVERLQTHEMYGCHWIQPLLEGMPEHRQGNWMFAGTFFWGWCKTIARFPRPALTHRHEAEGFCGYGYAEQPFPVFDPTPYFPNTAPFMDGWVGNPNYNPEQLGKSILPVQTINSV